MTCHFQFKIYETYICPLSRIYPYIHRYTQTHTRVQQVVLGIKATPQAVQSTPMQSGSLCSPLGKHPCNSSITKDAQELTKHTHSAARP